MSTEQQEATEAVKQVQCATELPIGTKAGAGFTSLGRCLQQARLSMGYSIQQVASEMHLDVRFIEFIEHDRLKELGAPVFVKGHLRRYARLVKVDDTLLQGLYESLRDPPLATDPIPVSMNSMPQPRRLVPNWGLWAAASVFVVISTASMLNKLNISSDLQASLKTPVNNVSNPVGIHKSPLQDALLETPHSSEKHGVVIASVAPVAAANAHGSDEIAAAHPMAPGHVALTLKFSGDSWTEIYDANKHAVMYEMGHENTVREVSGLAPLNVVLGSAPQVGLQVNGRLVTIPGKRVSASVARFMVDATGAIN